MGLPLLPTHQADGAFHPVAVVSKTKLQTWSNCLYSESCLLLAGGDGKLSVCPNIPPPALAPFPSNISQTRLMATSF